jgi:hypothetical protein
MKDTAEMGSNAMIYISGFVKIGRDSRKLTGRQTHRLEHVISLLLFAPKQRMQANKEPFDISILLATYY